MKSILLIILCLFCSHLFAQNERLDIIAKKIKSITTTYWTIDSAQKIEIKKYYTVRGDDSLEYYCGKLSFKFTTVLAKNGKVERLERSDAVDRLDELHMYKYNKDGSYSIEVIAHGAGTIIFSKYDKYNKCLEQTFSSIETIHYEYNDTGRLKRILYNEEKEKPVEMAFVVYNDEGLIEKIIKTNDPAALQSFKYNKFGLVSEKTQISRNEDDKEEKRIIFYEYEFWK